MENKLDKFDEIVYFNSEENLSDNSSGEIEESIKQNFHSIYNKNDFLIEKLIGKGSYSKIVKAKNLKLNKRHALKIIDLNFINKVKKNNSGKQNVSNIYRKRD